MLAEVFKKEFVFASNYFEELFQNKKNFPQSIIFEGLDALGQYFFTLELTRNLNCINAGAKDCDCINCRWIKENKHPAIISITPLTFKESKDLTHVISVKQIQKLTSELKISSDYHRFFIFSDAKKGKLNEFEKRNFEKYKELDFSMPEDDIVPLHLNDKSFDPLTLNALLKSVEEPPLKTTFVFLTKSREDIISTITSRSQVFLLPSLEFHFDFNTISQIFKNYPNITLKEALLAVDEIQKMMSENDMELADFLNMFEEYLGNLLKLNPNANKILNDIKQIQMARKQMKANMTPKTVLEYLMLTITTSYSEK